MLENKSSINPRTQREIYPDGGGRRGEEGRKSEKEEEEEERAEEERGKKDRKKKNEGGNCSVGRNPPSPFPGEEVD